MVKRHRPICQFLDDGTPVAVLMEYTEGYVSGDDYDALAARLAEAERDAARYRWLRLALSDQTSKGKSHWFCSITRGRPDELDAAIDAAREQEDKP